MMGAGPGPRTKITCGWLKALLLKMSATGGVSYADRLHVEETISIEGSKGNDLVFFSINNKYVVRW